MNGRKKICYLVGQISPLDYKSYEWRETIIKEMTSHEIEGVIEFINPCENNFNRKVLKEKRYAVMEGRIESGINILPHKDYSFVLESDIAIVNMNQYDKNKPLLGSFFELAWYFANPQKTVIGFADDLNSYECRHPFVERTVCEWCNNEYEAIDLLKKYFIN